MDDSVIGQIANQHGKSAAQVALRWLIQQPGMAAVPRALACNEIEEDIDVFDFELSANEMQRINDLRDKNIRIVDPEVRPLVWDVDCS